MRKLTVLVLILLVAVVCTGVSYAYTMSEKVVVATELVAIAKASAGGFTAEQRIDRINERLIEIISYERLSAGNIYVKDAGDCRTIMVGRKLLLTVTPADAAANNTTVADLAGGWLGKAKHAIPQSRPAP